MRAVRQGNGSVAIPSDDIVGKRELMPKGKVSGPWIWAGDGYNGSEDQRDENSSIPLHWQLLPEPFR